VGHPDRPRHTGEDILAAYIAKENLRELLALARTCPDRHRITQKLYDFYHWCAHTGIAELERLATTIERWWPAIEAFIKTGIIVANQRAEGPGAGVALPFEGDGILSTILSKAILLANDTAITARASSARSGRARA
jgi:transposase